MNYTLEVTQHRAEYPKLVGTSSRALSYTYGHTIHFHSEQDPPHPLQVPKQGTPHICVCVCVAACVNLLSTHAHVNPQCESPDIPTPDVTYLSRHTFSSFTDTFLLLTLHFPLPLLLRQVGIWHPWLQGLQ